jgi:hypothetical protein
MVPSVLRGRLWTSPPLSVSHTSHDRESKPESLDLALESIPRTRATQKTQNLIANQKDAGESINTNALPIFRGEIPVLNIPQIL